MNVVFLDCTLRDGGCVNDFAFGLTAMESIKQSLETAGIRYIELGYLDANKGSDMDSTMFISEESIERQLLKTRVKDAVYLAMIDCGKFSIEALPERGASTLDGIRLCFHKRQMDEAFKDARKILNKGYRLFIQPMVNTRYSDEDIINLAQRVNSELPEAEALYIVDSFGAMSDQEFINRTQLISTTLNPDIKIGIHSHNNQNQSFDVITSIITSDINRDIIIDATIAGIGKGAGNPNTMEVLNFYNKVYEQRYNLDCIKDVDAQYIQPIHSMYPWGFSFDFYLCAKYRITPSYLKFYKQHQARPEGDVERFLSTIPEDKKDAFNRDFAVAHYENFLKTACQEE